MRARLTGLTDLEQISVWACLTGLALSAAFAVMLVLHGHGPDRLAMLITAIGGFELYQAIHARWLRRRAGGGRG